MNEQNQQIELVFKAAEDNENKNLSNILKTDRTLVHATHGPRGDRQLPLHAAAHIGAINSVRVLVEYGADINARGHIGRTPLVMAANSKNKDVLQYLLQAGADPDIVDDIDNRAIHYVAGAWGDEKVYKELIKAGATEDWRSRLLLYGPAVILEEFKKRPEAVGEIDDMAHLMHDLIQSVVDGAELMDFLLAHGAKPHAVWNRRVPLNEAVMSNDVEMVMVLLKHGANPDRVVRDGRTILEEAKLNKRDRRIIAELVKHSGRKA